jgi:long-subunit fatty acid transport protein
MAGAFSGLADDATASFANPAGLTFLDTPEISFEFRGGSTTTPFLQGGRLSGGVSNFGTDTIAGPVFGSIVDRGASASYASFVLPHRSNRWVIAAYRHELAKIDQQYSYEGAYTQDPGELSSRRDSPQDGRRAIAVTGYGAAGAYKATRGLSVGAALVFYHFAFDSEFKRYFLTGFTAAPNRNVGVESLLNYTTQHGDSVRAAPVVGATFDRGRGRVGLVYRHGASFDFVTESPFLNPVTSRFRVPHTLSGGASWRLSSSWLLSGEVTRVGYSRLKDDFITIQASSQANDFSIDSGTELHGSVQYAWRRAQGPPIRLRAGAWFDPQHSVQFHPRPAANAAERTLNETIGAGLSKGSSQLHATGGFGWTLTPRFELNVGMDLAKRTKVLSTSLIVHLGGTP